MVHDDKHAIDPNVLKDIKSRLNKWKWGANILSAGLIILGFLAIASSVFVSAFIGTIDDFYIRIIAASSTVLFTLINSFNFKAMASNVRNGWKHLHFAMNKFQSKEFTTIDLLKAYEEGESMLGTVEFNFNKSNEDSK